MNNFQIFSNKWMFSGCAHFWMKNLVCSILVDGTLSYLIFLHSVIRRKWICDESPSVNDVLIKFPCFKEPKLVSFIMIKHLHMNSLI